MERHKVKFDVPSVSQRKRIELLVEDMAEIPLVDAVLLILVKDSHAKDHAEEQSGSFDNKGMSAYIIALKIR